MSSGGGFSLEAADRVAAELHEGQLDKAGLPYIEHPRAVARLTQQLGGTEHQQIAALLHDTVEDTGCTLSTLRGRGVPEPALAIVDALTRRSGERPDTYLARLLECPEAIIVKRADVMHNSDPARLAQLDPDVAARLRRKYAHTLRVLDRTQ